LLTVWLHPRLESNACRLNQSLFNRNVAKKVHILTPNRMKQVKNVRPYSKTWTGTS